MTAGGLGFCLFLATAIAPPLGADVGIVTILEGPGRLLRGPTWFTLREGGQVQEADLIDISAHAQAQVELADGVTVNLAGPATLYLASVPMRAGKLAGPAELFVAGGWLKVAARVPHGGLRLQTALGTIAFADAIVVVDAETSADAIFVESGTAQLTEPERRGAPAPSRNAKGGEFWSRGVGKPLTSASSPTPAFLASMPRQFIDPLPSRAANLRESHIGLAADRDVSYAEAKGWLVGQYRKAFLKRLRPRLMDPTFRGAVEIDIHAYPEWDRILHPEKYLPRKDGEKR